MKKFDFVTTGNSASLLVDNKNVVLNLSKQELFKLFAATEVAIDKVEETERNEKQAGRPSESFPEKYQHREWVNFGHPREFGQEIPIFGLCVSE